jgi:2'-5' RNA ligase
MQPVSVDEYSLWLEATPAEADTLRSLIKDFSRRADTLAFEPHLTLLPGLQGDEGRLVKIYMEFVREAAFVVIPQEVQTGPAYHKCLYLYCELSEPLLRLRKKAEKLFNTAPAFHPHISLAYGLDLPVCEAYQAELKDKSFKFTAWSISLWHAKGLPNEWRRVATHQLI